MSRTIIVSNRLPVSVSFEENEKEAVITESIGGLATGLKSVHSNKNSLWIGWSGILPDSISKTQRKYIDKKLSEEYRCLPIYLEEKQVDDFYYGFCNKTIWPLFHYFPNLTTWGQDLWEAYQEVNLKFYETLSGVIKSGDTIWVHDYQLLLLPDLIRRNHKGVKIGFFLHIPFPSFEIYRLLPVREEILQGMLGSDLIGFHTYDYVRHFLSSARRILGYENSFGRINLDDRSILIDAFPMGIDYERYNQSGKQESIREGTAKLLSETNAKQVVLSVDRLDYTKGLPERIRAFGQFLEENPNYLERVHLIIIAAPSRTKVDMYQELKREVEEMVSNVNGKYGKIGWIPVWFFYQSFTFAELAALYRGADVLLVTPLRDGMNLVVKEYIASRTDYRGAVILSETAGASAELVESIAVNPNDIHAIARAIKAGLEMPVVEQIKRNKNMHKRIQRYTVSQWAKDFLHSLEDNTDTPGIFKLKWLRKPDQEKLLRDYRSAKSRLLIFDYDGTLTPLRKTPDLAEPDKRLIEILNVLASEPNNTILIASGRKKEDMHKWFRMLHIDLSAEHGLWVRRKGENWVSELAPDNEWKDKIRTVIEHFVDRTPKSFIEEKSLGLAWHYRLCEPEQAKVRLAELKVTLMAYIQNMNLFLLDGSKVLEVRDANVTKGTIVNQWVQSREWDFLMCAGDDVTDEDMFKVLPEKSYSLKVGIGKSTAKFHVKDSYSIIRLLEQLIE